MTSCVRVVQPGLDGKEILIFLSIFAFNPGKLNYRMESVIDGHMASIFVYYDSVESMTTLKVSLLGLFTEVWVLKTLQRLQL